MLNPESVDYNRGKVKLTFTDDAVDNAVIIYLNENDAWRLAQSIIGQCNMEAKKKRSITQEQFDKTF